MKLSKVLASVAFFGTFATSQIVGANMQSAEKTEGQGETSDCCDPLMFDGLMGGLGIGLEGSKYKTKLASFHEVALSNSKTINRFNGVFWLAYGKTFNKFYFGVVFNGDFGGMKTKVSTYSYDDLQKLSKDFERSRALARLAEVFEKDSGGNASKINDPKFGLRLKSSGFSPAFALRFGYIPCSTLGLMAYLDLGATYRQVKVRGFDRVSIDGKIIDSTAHSSWVKLNKLMTLIRVGVQKKLCNNVAVDFNGEYHFDAKKTKSGVTLKDDSSWAVHLSAVYYINKM